MPDADSPLPHEPIEHEPTHRAGVAAVLVAALGAALAAALLGLPREGAPLPAIARYAMEVALPRWHSTEPVSEIVYGTRGFDTFGETFLLLAAVVSVMTLTRRRESRRGFIGEEVAGRAEQAEIDPHGERTDAAERQARVAEREEEGAASGGRPVTPDDTALGTPAPETAATMTVVIRTSARIAALVLGVAGLYLLASGYAPGGGFPAGAVMLGVILLLYAGFGYARIKPLVREERFEVVELLGAAAILATGVLGLVLEGSFTANFLPLAEPGTIRSGGVLQVFSASELVEVGTGLTLVIFALLGMRHDWSPDEDGGDSGDEGQRRGNRDHAIAEPGARGDAAG